jgi:hypothetical protein
MDAVEVVGGAEAGEVGRRVIATAGAEADVVDVERRAAAAGDLAEIAVAREDPLLDGVPLFELGSPGVDEVLRDPSEALVEREPPPVGRASGAEGVVEE